MKTYIFKKSHISKLPQANGVYIFKNKSRVPIYVGKSVNLQSRVRSYFASSLVGKTKQMIKEASYFSFIQVDSEFEALLLEAGLVRKYMTKYNSQLKDDKTPLYIGITREEFPRVITLRRTHLNKLKLKKSFGPFLNGPSAKKILKIIRKIFPFSTHKPSKRACLYSQIGLCKPCPSEIKDETQKAVYLKNISKIEKILSGKLKTLKKELEKEMRFYAKQQKFELARDYLNQLRLLEYITSPKRSISYYLKNPNLIEDIRMGELAELKKILNKYIKITSLARIECYDVAHLAGTYPTASMVTFINGEPDKRFYRHFRIKRKPKNDDYSNLQEVIKRRPSHFVNLIVVDGGKPQVSAVLNALVQKVVVIGFAKRRENIVLKNGDKFIEISLDGPALQLLRRLRDEAHRFAQRYHHKLVSMGLTKISHKKHTYN